MKRRQDKENRKRNYLLYGVLAACILGIPYSIYAETTDANQKDIIRQIAIEEELKHEGSQTEAQPVNEAVSEAMVEMRQRKSGETSKEYYTSMIKEVLPEELQRQTPNIAIHETEELVVVRMVNVYGDRESPLAWIEQVDERLAQITQKNRSWQIWLEDGVVFKYSGRGDVS